MTTGSIILAMTLGGIAIVLGIAVIVRVLARKSANKVDYFTEYYDHLTKPEDKWRP